MVYYWELFKELFDSIVLLCLSSLDKVKVLSLMLHAADISHPAKAWPLHYRWTHNLMEEFFQQVDTQTHTHTHTNSHTHRKENSYLLCYLYYSNARKWGICKTASFVASCSPPTAFLINIVFTWIISNASLWVWLKVKTNRRNGCYLSTWHIVAIIMGTHQGLFTLVFFHPLDFVLKTC